VRALLLESENGPSGLGIAEVDEPAGGEGMVLIEVHAAGVGFVDHLICRGEYQIRPPLPFVPGLEVAGVVRDAPEGSGFSPGMRVAAGTAFGGWAELVAAPAFLVMPLPDDTSIDAGAGFVVNFQTAHLALTRRGRLAEGEAVLVHGAAGGVGTACIQVARALGAGTIVGIASGRERMAVAMAAGADHALDAAEDWVPAVRELTGGRGADVVMEASGQPAAMAAALEVAGFNARLVNIGIDVGREAPAKLGLIQSKQLQVRGTIGSPGVWPETLRFLARTRLDLSAMVSARFSLEDAEQAYDAARRTGENVKVHIQHGASS
jgi:NADPH:quinone reductase-like Zn-dependent oxidoreductase